MTRPLWAERARGGTIQLDRDARDAGTVIVRGIAGELREALLNLVQNALDAMAGGGTLGLRTLVTDDEAQLEVRDSGIGMSAEVRERAFEPFFTTKGKTGTGLGLAEVYGIVKRHRGRAEIESTPGVGTTIRLVFPRSTVAARRGDACRCSRVSASRDACCSSRITRTAASSCRRCSSPTDTRWIPLAGVARRDGHCSSDASRCTK